MNYIKATLEDEVYQDLIKQKVGIQIDEMIDQKWYPEKLEVIDKKIKERGDWLRDNMEIV